MSHTLQSILVLLASAVVVVVLCRVSRLPAILGYLVIGVVVGPFGLRWIPDNETTRFFAEFGIVFLLFSIGLEFSLPQLKAMRRAVLGLGLLQVVGTTVVAMLAFWWFYGGWQIGLVLGAALAMSSTAIASKMLAERNELATPYGRDVMAILLFQDLAVVAFLIIIPSLAHPGKEMMERLGWAALKAAAVLSIILYFGQKPLRAWFQLIANQHSAELSMLNLLLVTLGLAALTSFAGLSLELGAFIAGMMIAETEFRYEVEEHVAPFRDVLLGLFFVTVGMSLDLHVVWAHFGLVLLLLLLPTLGKLLLVTGLARIFGAGRANAIRTGLYVAQAGELALVMLTLAYVNEVLDATTTQVVLAALVLSMLSGPLLIQLGDPLVKRFTANDWLARAAQITQIAARTMARQDHVIICGYGRSGQNLARLLEAEHILFIALDNDAQRVKEAAAGGGNVVFGDASRREALLAAGLMKARAVCVTFADTPLALKILHQVAYSRPELPVIVRTFDDSDIDQLLKAGAAEVVPEVLEGSLMLASHSLLLLGVPLTRVLARIRAIREERYSLFRGFFHGVTDTSDVAETVQPRLHSVLLTEGAAAVGKTLADVALRGKVEVTGVRRRGTRSERPGEDWRFEVGDVAILLGRPGDIDRAESRLLRGR
ncbi:MAG TPA: cation:proton antiporter [Casimicrobiaceae bacterium]|nr:cation:proton antiporter [Casimicrobiaceae bacterium]